MKTKINILCTLKSNTRFPLTLEETLQRLDIQNPGFGFFLLCFVFLCRMNCWYEPWAFTSVLPHFYFLPSPKICALFCFSLRSSDWIIPIDLLVQWLSSVVSNITLSPFSKFSIPVLFFFCFGISIWSFFSFYFLAEIPHMWIHCVHIFLKVFEHIFNRCFSHCANCDIWVISGSVHIDFIFPLEEVSHFPISSHVQ